MIKISIIGTGNVATQLVFALSKIKDIKLVELFGRSDFALKSFPEEIEKTTRLENMQAADFYIIAVSDSAIQEIASKIPNHNALVLHTSGSIPLNAMNTKNKRGVLYPLQTFSKNKEVDFSQVPICIEAENKNDLEAIQKLARLISTKTYIINSLQRKQLHLAAVFVCNFVNQLYQIGYEITQQHQLPFDILKPLIKETASKIEHGTPFEMQTGPAKRNDQNTIDAHLKLLQNHNHKEIYTLITNTILKTHEQQKL